MIERTVKHPHPSGRPIRRNKRIERQQWNYPHDPAVVCTPCPACAPSPNLPVADAIAYKEIGSSDSDWQGVHWVGKIGFVVFR
jgi:hypothetical protein